MPNELARAPQAKPHLFAALLLFAFFMISDPMTIPNRQGARILYAIAVAVLAFVWQFGWFKPNALLWSLFLCAPLVPVLDRIWPGAKATWTATER